MIDCSWTKFILHFCNIPNNGSYYFEKPTVNLFKYLVTAKGKYGTGLSELLALVNELAVAPGPGIVGET